MIAWREVAQADGGMVLYRIDAQMDHPGDPRGRPFDPVRSLLGQVSTSATARLAQDFAESGAPVGDSSMTVACHVVSYPDQLLVVDSTFPSTGVEVFPAELERIVRSEGRELADRPIDILYTHCHFDHAGGRDGVELLGGDVRTLAHPYTARLFNQTMQSGMFFASRAHFFRDCGIMEDVETLLLRLREMFMDAVGVAIDHEEVRSPYVSVSSEPLRVDHFIEPGSGAVELHDGRTEVLCFEGHVPGHLCVRVGGDHLITGDMWLPATTSTVTPPALAEAAGVGGEHCGIKLYMDSGLRLLDSDFDHCVSYPSHEAIFENPKRMAMRDLELCHERFQLIYGVLAEHSENPMRVLDLAWGGEHGSSVWKLESSLYRLLMAHDEAAAYVHDLVTMGDLEEVEPERYVYTGSTALKDYLDSALKRARSSYGDLEFRSYRLANRVA